MRSYLVTKAELAIEAPDGTGLSQHAIAAAMADVAAANGWRIRVRFPHPMQEQFVDIAAPEVP